MKIGFDRKAGAVAMVVLLSIGALIVLSLRVPAELRRDLAGFDHEREILARSQRIYITLLELQTLRRDALLTPAATNPQPYLAAQQRLDTELGRLSALAPGRTEASAPLAKLLGLVDAQRAELAPSPVLADKQGAGAVREGPGRDPGHALMEDIRTALAEMEAAESQARARRDAARGEDIDRAERYTELLAAAIGGLLLLLYLLVRRDKALRARMWLADEAARQDLERRVMERTAELRAASHALTLGTARLQGIFDAATDAILTADSQQLVVEANDAAARMFRCAKADLVGAPLERLIPARFHDSHRRDVEAFGASEDRARPMGRTQEVMGLRADGEEFPVDAGISHLLVDGERLYTVILRDITRRRQGEAALRAGKSRLEAALASMNEAVFISDPEGRIVEFNDAFVSFHRFQSREECRRRLAEYPEILEVCMADGTPAASEQWAMARALRGEVASNVEYGLRRRDTGQRWVGSCSFAPIRSDEGRIVGCVVTGRDITDIRRVQADLAASHAQLQQMIANQHRIQEEERRRIARELHDDLQQSLAAIRMDAVAAAERFGSGRGDALALLARIDRLSAAAIASTRRIVSDLRPEMLEDLGLEPALRAMCAQHAERTGTECCLEVMAGQGEGRPGNPAIETGLYRIAQEALNNVAKHARATTVSVRLDRSHDGLTLLRVSDNGVGLGAHERLRPGRFGLRGMVERARALGGQLRVEGRAGAGTTIEVLVPNFAPAAATAVGPDNAATGGSKTGRIAPPEPDAAPAARLDEWGQPLQTVIDALAGSVCVLGRQGWILLVNNAWHDAAMQGGDPELRGCGPGVNYLEVCRRSAATDPSAAPILHGLSEVLEGRQPLFSAEYPCDMPDGRHWFRMHAAPVTGGMLIVTHVDLSPRVAPGRGGSP